MTNEDKIKAMIDVAAKDAKKYDKDTIPEDYFNADFVIAFADIAKCIKDNNYCKATDNSQKLLKALVKVWKIDLIYEMLIASDCTFKEIFISDFFDYYNIGDYKEENEYLSPFPSMGDILTEVFPFESLLDLTFCLGYTIDDVYKNFNL